MVIVLGGDRPVFVGALRSIHARKNRRSRRCRYSRIFPQSIGRLAACLALPCRPQRQHRDMPRPRQHRFRFVSLTVATLAAAALSCAPPPAGSGRDYQPAEIPAAGRDIGVLPIFITDQTTDGRSVNLRGKIRNPYPESIRGVRLIYLDVAPGAPERILDHQLRILDVEIGSGQDTPLRWDIQTMYAGAQGGRFMLMAFA